MAFPTLTPNARRFSPGDFPIKRFKSQSGVETRVLYGSERTGMTMKLSYKNLTDANAELFINHYIDRKGTYSTFLMETAVPAITGTEEGTRGGWAGSNVYGTQSAQTGNKWRYAGPPQVTQVKPGISNVQVNLVGVL